MSTIIKPEEAVLPTEPHHDAGFTLPELLVSLCILMVLLQSVWQWSMLLQRTEERIWQNDQAIFIAQATLADMEWEQLDGWTIQVKRESVSEKLEQVWIHISYQTQQWVFYSIEKKKETVYG